MHVTRLVVVDLILARHLREFVDFVLESIELGLAFRPVIVRLVRPALERDGEIEPRVVVDGDRDRWRAVRLTYGTAVCGDVCDESLLVLCSLVDPFSDELRLEGLLIVLQNLVLSAHRFELEQHEDETD